jgi:hypothetical protein
MAVYRQTGDKKYLEPIPRALDYLKKSELPGGRIPRFLELKTNRPLYFTKQYELVYTSDDMPTHYSFIGGSRVDPLRAEYERLLATDASKLKPTRREETSSRPSSELAAAARRAIDGLDARGAWVEPGRLRADGQTAGADGVISTRTFMQNLETLSRFVGARE